MKKLLLIALMGVPGWTAEPSGPAELAQIRAVYLLPMGSGLEQYLASRLTTEAVLPVVTEPTLADAVLTDQIGAALEKRLEELYPERPEGGEEAEAQQAGPLRPSSFGRGKGNLFLVDLKSRRVLWSSYELADNTTPRELTKVSRRHVERLKRAIAGR